VGVGMTKQEGTIHCAPTGSNKNIKNCRGVLHTPPQINFIPSKTIGSKCDRGRLFDTFEN